MRYMMGVALLAMTCLAAQAGSPIPLQLPRPDGKAGDASKPVKVYILAGQSNMVGMGDITGAHRPNNVFYSADPALIPGIYRLDRPDDLKSLDGYTVKRFGVYDAKCTTTGQQVALGTTAKQVNAAKAVPPAVVTAQIDVPDTGVYEIHAGYQDSSHCLVELDGKEVYRKDIGGKPVLAKVNLEKGKRYAIQISYFKAGSAALWLEQVDMPGKGDLVGVTQNDKEFQYLLDDKGGWFARPDVTYVDARLRDTIEGGPLSALSNNGKSIGPEVGFGFVMGTFHDEQVLIIKTAQGNRSLNFDFRPPSSGKGENSNEYEGYEYRAMIKGVHETLAKIDKVVPGYHGQGYEIAGFFWWQGHKDSGQTQEQYEGHLVNLINDVRKEFNVPKLPVVVATVGFHGYRLPEGWQGVWEAQMAVGDPKQHPEYAGTVSTVDIRDYWRETEESPRGQDYHYNRNAGTYMMVGEAAGRAMVRLEGGQAEAMPKSDREQRVAAEDAQPKPTAEQMAAHTLASRPLVIDGALQSFIASPRNQTDLTAALASKKPAKATWEIDDALNLVAAYYHDVGIDAYDWKPLGSGTANATWQFLTFDLPDHKGKAKIDKNAKADGEEDQAPAPKAKKGAKAGPPPIVLPAGTENWFAPDFDAAKAGWKTGPAPFGEPMPTDAYPDWMFDWLKKRAIEPRVPATVTNSDVLLMRQTFDLPAAREGYRYRIRIAGSPHANMGEGFAIYINGKLLMETRDGLTAWHRQVFKTRGAMVYPEFRDQFTGGKVTIAIANYPLWGADADKLIAPGPALRVCVEEQEIPPLEN